MDVAVCAELLRLVCVQVDDVAALQGVVVTYYVRPQKQDRGPHATLDNALDNAAIIGLDPSHRPHGSPEAYRPGRRACRGS